MSKEELLFCPLGGSGEIGGNMNLYAYGKESEQKWIIVDMGVSFADDSVPGIDLIIPDAGFIIEKKEDLLGIILTHAHEDHIGAVAHIWPNLKCKIYATPFTAALILEKFKEKRIDISSYLEVVPLNSKIKLENFEIDFITLTHSILEPNGLSIKTPIGTVLHTGDWKIDPNPLIGGQIDEKKLKFIGESGVSAMICDSTNIFSPGRAGSESDVRDSLLRIMELKTNRILVTSFASNVARMESIFYCAKKTGRNICLVGRSMQRIYKAARKCGYLKGLIEPLEPRDAKKVPKNKILYLATGSQGEPMGAMNRIINGVHPDVHLEKGDAVSILDVNKKGKFIYLSKDKENNIREKARENNSKTGIIPATVKELKQNEVQIPATWFLILNSLFIIAFAPLFSRWWESKYNPSAASKYGLGLILLGIGFGALAFGSMAIEPGAKTGSVSLIWLVLAYLFHTLGELCLSPVALSYVSKLVPGRMIAMMFGIWYIAVAIGNKLAGILGGKIEKITEHYDMTTFFLIFTVIPIGLGLLGVALTKVVNRLMHGVK